MVSELVRAFLFIFIAEMGDKTQILAMAFATKYKVKQVVLGIVIGSFLNHALAVLLGSNLQRIIPLNTLSIVAGFSFILFGVWSLKFDDEEEKQKPDKYGPVMTVSIAFFIGELGDKTQLTAIALSSDAVYPIFILMGTVLGMMVTGLIGIFIGMKLGSKIDDFYIKIAASIVFFVFGYLKLFESLESSYLTPLNIIVFTSIVVLISSYLLIPVLKSRTSKQLTLFQITARKLNDYYSDMYEKVNDICLGEEVCGVCNGKTCLVGYTKSILLQAQSGIVIDYNDVLDDLIIKDYDRVKVLESYIETIKMLKKSWEDKSYIEVHKVRNIFEKILYHKEINIETYQLYMDYIKQFDVKLHNLLKDTN